MWVCALAFVLRYSTAPAQNEVPKVTAGRIHSVQGLRLKDESFRFGGACPLRYCSPYADLVVRKTAKQSRPQDVDVRVCKTRSRTSRLAAREVGIAEAETIAGGAKCLFVGSSQFPALCSFFISDSIVSTVQYRTAARRPLEMIANSVCEQSPGFPRELHSENFLPLNDFSETLPFR